MKVEGPVEPQASLAVLREVIDAVFEPSIHFPSLGYGLDALAHVCLLSVRLRGEIVRMTEHYKNLLDADTAHLLQHTSKRCVEAETALWDSSTYLRELHIANIFKNGQIKLDKISRLVKVYFPKHDAGGSLATTSTLYTRAMPRRSVERHEIVTAKMDRWLENYGTSAVNDDVWADSYGTAAQSKAVDTLAEHVDTILESIAKAQNIINKIEKRKARVGTVSEPRHEVKFERGQPPSAEPKSASRDRTLHSTDRAIKSEGADRAAVDQKIVPAKKRSRPSFPPREGIDYTQHLPVAGSNKRQRLRPFQTSDLK